MGPPFLPSLKWLAKKYLRKDIQVVSGEKIGHDSIEDAAACVDLLKLKIRNGKFHYILLN
jgi:RNA exonuclease 1